MCSSQTPLSASAFPGQKSCYKTAYECRGGNCRRVSTCQAQLWTNGWRDFRYKYPNAFSHWVGQLWDVCSIAGPKAFSVEISSWCLHWLGLDNTSLLAAWSSLCHFPISSWGFLHPSHAPHHTKKKKTPITLEYLSQDLLLLKWAFRLFQFFHYVPL